MIYVDFWSAQVYFVANVMKNLEISNFNSNILGSLILLAIHSDNDFMIETILSSPIYSSDAACNTLTRIIRTLTGKFFLLGAFDNDRMISVMLFFEIGSFYSHILSKNITFSSLSFKTESDFLLN